MLANGRGGWHGRLEGAFVFDKMGLAVDVTFEDEAEAGPLRDHGMAAGEDVFVAVDDPFVALGAPGLALELAVDEAPDFVGTLAGPPIVAAFFEFAVAEIGLPGHGHAR